MLQGLHTVFGGDAALPFVRQFYGSASTYLWEDQDGIVHTIMQAEGGEQGDPFMPALFALGQHPALQALQAQLQDDERLFAFLDDVYVVCSPDWVSAIFGFLEIAGSSTLPSVCTTGKPRCGTRKVWCHMAST